MSGRGRSDGPEMRILFVCTGNTCRSPMAEGIARTAAARRGMLGVRTRSAGTAAERGAPAAAEARRVAAEHGIDLEAHVSRPVEPADLEWADLIVTMSPEHVIPLETLGEVEKTALATAFLPEGHPARGLSVPDPVGGGRAVYVETFEILSECVAGLLDTLDSEPDDPGG